MIQQHQAPGLIPGKGRKIFFLKASIKESEKEKSRRQNGRRRLGRPQGKPKQATTSPQMRSR